MSMSTQRQKVLELSGEYGTFTSRCASARGIHSQTLTRLVAEGLLERIGRGHYRWPGADVSEHHDLVLATEAIQHGVVCLLSALQYHDVGTQMTGEVWIAIPRRSSRPRVQYPPVRILRFSDETMAEGREVVRIEGRLVPIFSLEKTIADCFKYRNKLGLDVALEALQDSWRERKLDLAALCRYAALCRVRKVIQPYLEALV
jgi:predicted transcriptional regulator of viral defense system